VISHTVVAVDGFPMKTISNDDAIDVVVAGYLGVDLTPGFARTREPEAFPDLFRPGKLIETEGLEFSLGGVVANTGLAMRKFGARVALMGCVGCDTLGDFVVARLEREGGAAGVRRNPRASTAYGIVIAPPGADRVFLEDPGCNRVFSADDIDYDVVARGRLFHFGYPPLMESLWTQGGLGLRSLLERVRRRGVAISLDMSLPDPASPAGKADWHGILADTLPLVDIFAPSIEELLFMLEPETYGRCLVAAAGEDLVEAIPQECYRRLADRVLAWGAKVVLIKAGHRGAYLQAGDTGAGGRSAALQLPAPTGCEGGLWIPPLPVDRARFRNACGAGDCAVAGFLTALLEGAPLVDAARFAMRAGRDNLYGADAVSGLSDWGLMAAELGYRTRQGASHG
jgi:sugar/nucleoside kinase (ribokinase family)